MQILELNKAGLQLSVNKGFLVVKSEGGESRVCLDLIEAVIINSYGMMISNQTLIALCDRCIPLIICGNNSVPIGILNSSTQNVYRKSRIEAQISASIPLQKRLWQQIVSSKIANQSQLLKQQGLRCNDLDLMAKKVSSGDIENLEAQAARIYWKRLFGLGFKRDPDLSGINAYLNYGYAILRAAFCREIVARGLIPEIGLHHRNMMNPFCLADDLMEPYRPFIDKVISAMNLSSDAELNPCKKKELIALLNYQLRFENKTQYLRACIAISTQRLVDSYANKKAKLSYPILPAQWIQADVDDGDV